MIEKASYYLLDKRLKHDSGITFIEVASPPNVTWRRHSSSSVNDDLLDILFIIKAGNGNW